MCQQTSLISLCDEQEDVKKLFGESTGSVIDLLSNSFYESEATQSITQLPWYDDDETTIAFTTSKSLINKNEVANSAKQYHEENEYYYTKL